MSRFNYKINYRPGPAHGKVDALTRQGEESNGENEEREQHRVQTLLKSQWPPDADLGLLASTPSLDGHSRLETLFDEVYDTDPFPLEILDMLRRGERISNKITFNECKEHDGRLLYRCCLYIPDYDDL